MNFLISLFDNVGDTRPKPKACTWQGFCVALASPKVRQEKDGQLFSPARYRGSRRLQPNVIDLSMLVLEIDGAWRCECCGQVGPHVMFVSNRVKDDAGRVDRAPRCPSCLKAKCAKCYVKKPKPRTETVLNQIEFTFASVVEGMRRVFQGSAFAIYSTHSHQRATALKCGISPDVKAQARWFCERCHWDADVKGCGAVYGHEVAERCYRLIVPLAQPVPVADFPSLWLSAVNSLHKSEVVADPQAKDPNRIFYTPVKFSDDAAYEFHVEPGEFFNWRQSQSGVALKLSEIRDDRNSPAAQSAQPSEHHSQFATHEDRNEELGRRIAARGKQNGRGHFDAKCLAHNGRGSTSLVFFPESGAVQCNAGCDYYDILKAESLPDNPLPTRDMLAVEQARYAGVGYGSRRAFSPRPKSLTTLDLDVIYSTWLAYFCELSSEHEAQIRRDWQMNPFGAPVEWPGLDDRPSRPLKIASMPNSVQRAGACRFLSERFDLRGVPGFYLDVTMDAPRAPTRANERARWQTENFGQWRIYLPYKSGLLVPYYDDPSGYVIGIKTYQSVKDAHPTLLTSRGLPGGAKALMPREERVA